MAPPVPLRGRQVLLAALIGGALGAAMALMLKTVVSNTPAQVSPRTYLIFFVIFCAFGAVAGLTLEAVRQLQERNPDPAYHRQPRTAARRQRPQRHRPLDDLPKGD
ncbi:hypothetical protein [Cyanobium sp. Morenito 9A2]|uniref:hypothetical protein n=1 Tax=Cyanobium sp. Morenito 9A2 TaxID=2823718 RepID=UPI0020CE4686|nr:hypothetical protein [Cyanobium sp. Morenito 9A2]MCP9849850.1 hypothetical protein [Cyanobium sp. Morenito 9A2]